MTFTSRFGRATFGSAPFNTSREAPAYMSVNAAGNGHLEPLKARALMTLSCCAEGQGDMSGYAARLFYSKAEFSGEGSISASAIKYYVFSLPGPLYPGDLLEINSENLTVSLNGSPIYNYTGGFFNLPPGEVSMIYQNESTITDVTAVIQYEEKYL